MECPKCHHKIGKTDWSQSCKNCGVNLIYYNLEESMRNDAKLTEISFAKVRIFAAKVKCAFVGGALQIVRLVMLFGCVGLLMIPFCSVSITTSLYSDKLTFNMLEAYNAVTAGKLAGLSDSAVAGALASKSMLLYYIILALAVACILQLVLVIISIKKPRAVSGAVAAVSFIGIAGSIACAVVGAQLSLACVDGFSAVKGGFGAYAALVGFAVMFVLNLIMCIKGIEIKYKPGDLYRVEVGKKLKAGEVTVNELPLPVFETEEEKAERLAELEDAEEKEEVANG